MKIAIVHALDCAAVPGSVPELQRPPAEVYSIVALLRAFKLDAEIVEIYSRSREELLANARKVAKKLRPDLVGLTCLTVNRFDATDAAEAVKQANPDARVLLHGPHASAMHAQLLNSFDALDGVIVGEPEATYLEYARKMNALLPTDGIHGLSARNKEGRVTYALPRKFVDNLDSMPSPGKFINYASVLTSRGCPEGGAYLPERLVFGERLRFRSPENVFGELLQLKTDHGREVFFFADEDFTASRDHALAICKRIVEGGLKISFEINSHPNHIGEERLEWLKRAGCFRITYHVESGAEAVLRALGRPADMENAVKMCHLTRKHGIHARWRIMLGAPGETRETVEATKRFIEKSRPSSTIVQAMQVCPGTPLYENALKNGSVDEGLWLKREVRMLHYWPKELEAERDKIVRDFMEFTRLHSFPFTGEEREFFNAKYPDDIDHLALGRKNLERGNLQEAIAEYELAIQGARTTDAAVAGLVELAKCEVLVGAYSSALAVLRSADRLVQPAGFTYPKTVNVNPVVTGLMAECYANLREFAECRTACERLIAAVPEHPYAHYLLSLCLIEGPEPDRARAAAECKRAQELGYKVPAEHLERMKDEV